LSGPGRGQNLEGKLVSEGEYLSVILGQSKVILYFVYTLAIN